MFKDAAVPSAGLSHAEASVGLTEQTLQSTSDCLIKGETSLSGSVNVAADAASFKPLASASCDDA